MPRTARARPGPVGPGRPRRRSTPPSRPRRTTTASTSAARIDQPVRPPGVRLDRPGRPARPVPLVGAVHPAPAGHRRRPHRRARGRRDRGQLLHDAGPHPRRAAARRAAARRSATIAKEYGRDLADVTDRQNVQYHWIRIEDVPADLGAAGGGRPVHHRGLRRRAAQHPRLPGGRASTPTRSSTPPPCCGRPRRWRAATRTSSPTCRASARRRSAAAPRTAPRTRSTTSRSSASSAPDGTPGFDLWVGGGLSTNPMLAQRLGVFVEPDQVPAVWAGRDRPVPRLRLPAAAQPGPAEVPGRGLGRRSGSGRCWRRSTSATPLPDGPAPPPPRPPARRDHVGVHRQQRRPVLRRRRAARRPHVRHPALRRSADLARGVRLGPGPDDGRAEAADPRRARRRAVGRAGRRAGRPGPAGAARRCSGAARWPAPASSSASSPSSRPRAGPATCTPSWSGGCRTSTRRSPSTSTAARTPAPGSSSPTSASRARSSTATRASRSTWAARSAPTRSFGRKLRGLKVTAERAARLRRAGAAQLPGRPHRRRGVRHLGAPGRARGCWQ